MKEKIERFSKGNFEYELPLMCLSEEEIRFNVEAGKTYSHSFTITSSDGSQIEGVVYSSSLHMVLKDTSFDGTENIINYTFDATSLKAGEEIHGELIIVSNCKECSIPFIVQIEAPCYMSSLGKIKDLFQFTNLARMDWSEAKKVFRSEEFEQLFLENEERFKYIYRNLLKSTSTSQALEEFLIAIHKKAVIRLEVDKTQVEFHASLSEPIVDRLTLTKNHWGYAEIRVSTDAPFILLEQKFLWSDRFIGNTHQVTYSIDPKKLKYGNSYGTIYIKTAYQTITVKVLCKKRREDSRSSQIRANQRLSTCLTENYLKLRLNRIGLNEYIEKAEAIRKELPGPEVSYIRELFQAHLAIIAGRSRLAEELLGDLGKEELTIKRKSVPEYCTYLYLEALYRKDDITTTHAVETIRRFYKNGFFDWRILWLLLNTDKQYEKNKGVKLADIKEQFDMGCRSPILYYEAVCIINEEPFLLRDLTSFEIQIMNFAIKNKILSKEAALQFTYLAGKRKTYDPVIFASLVRLYDDYETTEILAAICSLLIKGMKKSQRYFEWYRLGVDAQLRITELYEYYMYSISEKTEEALAQPVLLYFIYNSSINEKKKAFLFANIIKNKGKLESIYRTYYKRMEVFAAKMLEGRYVSSDLAILYKEFLNRNTLKADQLQQLPYIIYRKELVCQNPNILSAIVVHREMGTEENVSLTDGRAQVDIYTSNAEIFLVDGYGNRYVESMEYTVTPYLNPEDYEKYCLGQVSHPMFLMHLYDRYQSYRVINEDTMELRKQVMALEGLAKEYVTECCQELIEYYYVNYDDELLEYYLNQIDLKLVRASERTKFMEYMVIRAFYDKALQAFESYGYEVLTVSRLVKFCSGWIQATAAKKNDLILSICYYVYTQNKYDDGILAYLVSYYNGTTRDMFKLWQAAKAFEIPTVKLSERLLIQMLFSESYLENSFEVFLSYYKDVTNHILVRAFLNFHAYKYLVHDQVIDEGLFTVMKRELCYEENLLCLLSWLKYHAEDKQLSQNDLLYAEFNIDRLTREGRILPFFKDYSNKLTLPEILMDKCYITYHGDPAKRIFIHYCLPSEKEQEFITERMDNVFLGIHVKEFVLFHHEVLQYYISEEAPEGTTITESYHIQYDCETPEDDLTKYNQINLMLLAMEMKDENTLLQLMEDYARNEYMIEECFEQLK